MSSVYIGIGHDNDLMISQFCNIKVLMDTCSECSDHCFDLAFP